MVYIFPDFVFIVLCLVFFRYTYSVEFSRAVDAKHAHDDAGNVLFSVIYLSIFCIFWQTGSIQCK